MIEVGEVIFYLLFFYINLLFMNGMQYYPGTGDIG